MSLIGMHSAARDGFAIPPATAKWKYLKGSEKDFAGAPEWVRFVITGGKFVNKWLLESFEKGSQRHVRHDTHYMVYEELRLDKADYFIIAQREPVTAADVEVVKYDPDKIDIAKEFLPEGYPENGQINHKCGELKIDGETHDATINKYTRDCKGVQVDVYDVLQAFDVTNPALQHLIKKALCVGIRGHKTKQQDLQDIIDSAIRAKELEQ